MADVIVEKDGDGGTGSSAIWAIAFIIIVALIAGAVYYSGILTKAPAAADKKINVEVSAPSSSH